MGALEADVVAKVYYPNILVNPINDPTVTTPVVDDLGDLVLLTVPLNFSGEANLDLPLVALDEFNQPIPIASPLPLVVKGEDVVRYSVQAGPNGEGIIKLTLNINPNTREHPIQMFYSRNEGSSGSAKLGRNAGPSVCLIPIQSTPDFNRKNKKYSQFLTVDRFGEKILGQVVFNTRLPEVVKQLDYNVVNDPSWNDYMKSQVDWANKMSEKWNKLVKEIFLGDFSKELIGPKQKSIFTNKSQVINFNYQVGVVQRGTLDFVFNAEEINMCPFSGGCSTATGYGILNGLHEGVRVQGSYESTKLTSGKYKIRISANYTFGDITDFNKGEDDRFAFIVALTMGTNPEFHTTIQFPADGEIEYNPVNGQFSYNTGLGWPFDYLKQQSP